MKRLLGYASQWSVRPGDTVDFFLSSEPEETVSLDIVRVINGAPAALDLRPIPGATLGSRPVANQPIRTGSYLTLTTQDGFAQRGVTVAFSVKPTRDALACILDTGTLRLWRDAGGSLALEGAGGPNRVACQRIGRGKWHSVRIVLDAIEQSAVVTVETASAGPASTISIPLPLGWQGIQSLSLGAKTDGSSALDGVVSGFRLWGADESSPDIALDFRDRLDCDQLTNRGTAKVDARLVNAPTRGVPGPNWAGQAFSPAEDQALYDAVHFHSDDLEDARWEASASWVIPPGFESGSYALRARGSTETTYVPFFVNPARAAPCRPVALLASTFTYHAYANHRIALESPEYEISELSALPVLDEELQTLQHMPELGASHYDRHVDGHPIYVTTRRRPILNMTPDTSNWSYNADTSITAFLHAREIDHDIVTDDLLHNEGVSALDGCRVLITGTHPEYLSTCEWDALVAFLDRGGRLIYLGGNGFYWRVAIAQDRPWLMELRRAESGARYNEAEPAEYHMQFNGERGGLWRRLGRPPQGLVGVGMVADGWDRGAGYRLTDAARDPRVAFAFEGVHGDVLGAPCDAHPGAAGQEVDAADPELGTPDHALVIASSTMLGAGYYLAPEEVVFLHSATTGDVNARVRADLTFFETPAGGAVFSTGSIAWGAAMAAEQGRTDVGRLTENAIRRFGDPRPFAFPQASGPGGDG